MNVYELTKQVAANSDLKRQLQEDPEETLKTVAAVAPLQSDVAIYRIVVGSLGLVLILTVIGISILSFWGKAIPEQLGMLASGAVGALAGLLAPTPRQS